MVTSVDHKRIGVMYVLLALVLLLRGFIDAIMMRSNSPSPQAARKAIFRPSTTTRFSAHGTIMIFFMAMSFLVGLMNFVSRSSPEGATWRSRRQTPSASG